RAQTILAADGPDRRLERPEALTEGHLLLVAEALIGEDEHRIFLEGAEDPLERALVHGLSQIDALDASSKIAMNRRDRQRAHGHGASLPCRRDSITIDAGAVRPASDRCSVSAGPMEDRRPGGGRAGEGVTETHQLDPRDGVSLRRVLDHAAQQPPSRL